MKQDTDSVVDGSRREVRSTERDGQPARALVLEHTYDTNVDDVWDAVTNPERIPRWLMPIEGDLEVGGRYQLVGNASGEVLACEPPSHLALTWEFGGAVSWVDVHLDEGSGGGTRLRLEHVALVDDSEMWEQFGPGAVGIGWDLTFLGLSEHLRTGESVDIDAQAAAEAAAGGGPAADFMARRTDAWCAADIASGTPEGVARAAAERTLAMYTGGGDHHEPGGEGSGGEEPGGGGGAPEGGETA